MKNYYLDNDYRLYYYCPNLQYPNTYHRGDDGTFLTVEDQHWYLLSKPQWISPARVDFSVDKKTLLRHKDLHFQHMDTALCAVQVKPNTAGFWCEQQRWLIMPDQWPKPG